jgi:hypothetical protein
VHVQLRGFRINPELRIFLWRSSFFQELAMQQLAIRYQAISTLKPRPNNPRTHTKKQIRQIAGSIERFGFTNPVLVDDDNGIVAGHGRVEAAKLLKLIEVPTVRLSGMSAAEVRAYVIADNQHALNAGWDFSILGAELKDLSTLMPDLDMSVLGLDWGEVDVLIEAGAKPDKLDLVPALKAVAVCRTGDLFTIGPHRLICGDATQASTFAALLGDERAQMSLCDFPYNVPIAGHVSGLGKHAHREFAMASGEMTPAQFIAFLSSACRLLAQWSIDGALHFGFMDWRHSAEMLAAGEAGYSELKAWCVWAKTNAGMGSLYRSQHEFVFVHKSGQAPHINNIELGKHGRYRTNIWTYAGANSFGKTRDDDLAMHPTVKPVAMLADAILDASRPHGIILDAFAGSGSTLVAAHKTRRRGYGIEIDPLYCDVILRRLAKLTGLTPIHVATGLIFTELAQQRADEAAALLKGEDAA